MKNTTNSKLTALPSGIFKKCFLATLLLFLACESLASSYLSINTKSLIINDLNDRNSPTDNVLIAKKAFGMYPNDKSEILPSWDPKKNSYSLGGSYLTHVMNFEVEIGANGIFDIVDIDSWSSESGSGLMSPPGTMSFETGFDFVVYGWDICLQYYFNGTIRLISVYCTEPDASEDDGGLQYGLYCTDCNQPSMSCDCCRFCDGSGCWHCSGCIDCGQYPCECCFNCSGAGCCYCGGCGPCSDCLYPCCGGAGCSECEACENCNNFGCSGECLEDHDCLCGGIGCENCNKDPDYYDEIY